MTISQHATAGRSRPLGAPSRLLSHHAIMALVGPFSRRGYTVDLAASDRANGVLVFRPVEVPAEPQGRPALRSVLRLERPHRAKLRVIRTLETDDGRAATMTAEGDDAEVLLDTVERVDPGLQFHVIAAGPFGAGGSRTNRAPPVFARPTVRLLVTRSYRAQVWLADAPGRGRWRRDTIRPQLTSAEAHLGPLRLVATDGDGWACEVRLIAREGASLELPTDFLAVLGWGWRPLRRHDPSTWLGRISVARRRGPGRTAALHARLDTTVEHIVETLAAPPADFHQKHRAARWRAALQRLLPLLFICGGVVGLFLAVMYAPRTPGLHMLLNNLAIAAVAAFVMRDKAYRVEIPPRPRPLDPTKWDAAAAEELSAASAQSNTSLRPNGGSSSAYFPGTAHTTGNPGR